MCMDACRRDAYACMYGRKEGCIYMEVWQKIFVHACMAGRAAMALLPEVLLNLGIGHCRTRHVWLAMQRCERSAVTRGSMRSAPTRRSRRHTPIVARCRMSNDYAL